MSLVMTDVGATKPHLHRLTTNPIVSIGLPVFNGENYLKEAIESVLAQRYADLELIICDNASTDGTRDIGERYARLDSRVHYVRNASNLGAAPNYNRAFELSRGRYLKWLAHDDRIAPDYLSKTVAALEARPELVLCNTSVEVIDDIGRVIGTYDSVLEQADRPSAVERFAVFVLQPHTGVDIFGVIRRPALTGSLLHASFHGADRALLAQLALRGPMLQRQQPLHQIREHANRYTRQASSARLRANWHDPQSHARSRAPILQLYSAYLRMVRQEPLSAFERWQAWQTLARWWVVNWNSARVVTDVASLLLPSLVGTAEKLKTRLAGAPPGHFHQSVRSSRKYAGGRK